jgi:sugar O-acyltransferase (sialic acid O-acetyltransferase NeuD family)
MKKDKLLIIGAGGHGRVVADIAKKLNRYSYIAFLDDDQSLKSRIGIEVIGCSDDISNYISEYDIFVAIGKNDIREKFQSKLEGLEATIPVLIHPNAVIGENVKINEGTVVMAGVIINCGSTIGKGCIINTSASIDHDDILEDFIHISPGAHLAGTVKIGTGSWIGIGATVSNNLSIISNCIIGAGAVVIKDIKETGIYIGVPVRIISKEYI